MESSPHIQNDYVRDIDERTGGKTKPLIRFLKAWKYYNNVPISSFYLELVTAKHAASAGPIIYSWDLRDTFKKLRESRLAEIDDPAGTSGGVSACHTTTQKDEALGKVERAATRATLAKQYEDDGKTAEAFDWWDRVFNGKFPSYSY